ncbi:hypothetical protein [Nitrobacter sp.]|uniref:hypothetical protein n=1 Tax=Nitrobacter sp. TaxID=29420 RepID=UPI0029CABD2A|nr:hypothetical protein [Nitrobacter sp.]
MSMDTDLDRALGRLTAAPPHPGLAGLEAAVFARIDAERRADIGSPLRLGVLAAIGAITMGVASVGVSTAPTRSASTLSPFDPSSPLAPSTLLASVR